MGVGPARATTSAGVARSLPTEFGVRDGSGVSLNQSIALIGPSFEETRYLLGALGSRQEKVKSPGAPAETSDQPEAESTAVVESMDPLF